MKVGAMGVMADDLSQAGQLLGRSLRARRLELGIAQNVLAAGLCAQSLINKIEQGRGIPNAILLTQLCERLRLPMKQALRQNYPIRRQPTFSRKVHKLYQAGRFAEVVAYMDDSDLLPTLKTDEDLKTFYYYYGWSLYQATQESTDALQHVRTALTMMVPQRPTQYRSLEVLLISVENYLVAASQPGNFEGFERALAIMRTGRVMDPDENLNAVFYQYAQVLLQQGQINRAVQTISAGVNWATAHDSHYLLADDYTLLAQAYLQAHQSMAVAQS